MGAAHADEGGVWPDEGDSVLRRRTSEGYLESDRARRGDQMTALLINPFSFQAISSEEGASALGARNLATLRTPEIDRADAVAQAYFAMRLQRRREPGGWCTCSDRRDRGKPTRSNFSGEGIDPLPSPPGSRSSPTSVMNACRACPDARSVG